MAKKFHPDVNKDPDAQEIFTNINAAYNVLSDDVKRKNYDTMGQSEQNEFENMKNGEDIFKQFFGRRRNKTMEEEFNEEHADQFSDYNFGKKNGFPKHLELEVNYKDTIYGKSIQFPLSVTQKCKQCNGTGVDNIRTKTCLKCNGLKKVQVNRKGNMIEMECPSCGGSGFKFKGCLPCGQSGFEVVEKNVTVSIPSGIKNGEILTLKGLGEPGFRGGENGDLFVNIKIIPDSVYSDDPKEKNGIKSNMEISLFQALLGSKIDVKNPDGTVTSINIPRGTQNNNTIKIPNKGIGFKGPHTVNLSVKLPTELNENQIKLIEDLKNSFNK